MADIQAKMVRTLIPAGVTVNFVGNAGNSYHAYPISTSLIGKMIERGVLVYEQLEEEDENGQTEVLLTSDTYTAATEGAVEVSSDTIIIPDFEQEIIDKHNAEYEELLAEKGLNIKEKQTLISEEYLGIGEEQSTVESGQDTLSGGTVQGGTGQDTLTGNTDETLEGGNG